MKHLIFFLAMACTIAVFAEAVEINGDFKKVKGNKPVGWLQNKGNWAKPYGNVEAAEGTLKITNTDKTKRTDSYSSKTITAKAGDKVKLTIKAKGKGTFGAGIYVYNEKSKWCGASYKKNKLKPEMTEFTVIVPVKDRMKDGKVTVVAGKFKVVLQAISPNTEVIFESVKVEVIPAE
jgi:hypothetical protein